MRKKKTTKRITIQFKNPLTNKSKALTIEGENELDAFNKVSFLYESLAKTNDFTIIKFWKQQPKEEKNE